MSSHVPRPFRPIVHNVPRHVLDHHVGHLVRRKTILAEEEQRRQVATGAVDDFEGLGRQRVAQGQQAADGGLRGFLVSLEAAEEGDLGVDACRGERCCLLRMLVVAWWWWW